MVTSKVATTRMRHRGSLRGLVTFYWWTETGTAEAGRDFTHVLRRWEVIEDGAAGIDLQVMLMHEAGRTQPRTFYVKLDRAGLGATLAVARWRRWRWCRRVPKSSRQLLDPGPAHPGAASLPAASGAVPSTFTRSRISRYRQPWNSARIKKAEHRQCGISLQHWRPWSSS